MIESATGGPQGTPLHTRESSPALWFADDNMVLAQRLAEWISNAAELEIDIALGNIALDHLGVARALYTHVAETERLGKTENDFAMRRTEREYTNLLLVEQPNGDFAQTMVRQTFFDVYQSLLWAELAEAGDEAVDTVLAGIAAKAAKEAAYHLEFSSGWLIRLGDGTEESHQRAQDAVDALWRFTGELSAGYEEPWRSAVEAILTEATLKIPDDPYQRTGGRLGYHTEYLGHLLAEMQWMDRAYPGLQW